MFNEPYKKIERCRVCHSDKLTAFWSMGECCIVEFPLIGSERTKPLSPLTLVVCENCWLVQLQHTTDPKYLYSEFFYRSGMNEMMRAELRDIAHAAVMEAAPAKGDYVLDIGCNDGTLLESYPAFVEHKVGIDPAKNIFDARKPWNKDWKFECDFFNAEKALKASKGYQYKIITAIAMFYDLDDPAAFCRDISTVLHEDGVFIVQMNYLGTMLEAHGVDNVCHEHLTYFSLTSLFPVFDSIGLEIYKVEVNATNGGSLRVFVCHAGHRTIDRGVRDLLMKESDDRLLSFKPYGIFNERVQAITKKLDIWLNEIATHENAVYAYGASTRGTTLMQLLHNADLISGVAERDPNKFGHYMIGTETPIYPEAEVREIADYLLVLPWHFLPAIQKREHEWLLKGGKFIVPFPQPKIISLTQQASGVMELIDASGVFV
jgi:NDP-4-keto-2,6-dideoxyhexose 3-C-methyltransferase